MPNTRSSQGNAQPQLPFPRRKSSRSLSRSKALPPDEPAATSTKLKPQQVTQASTRAAPMTPGRPQLTPRSAQSSGAVQPPALSPRLQPRLPLSPRKRTGDENSRNVGSDLLGSPPKLSRPSTRKLGFDENFPVSTHPLPPASPSPAAAVVQSPKQQETQKFLKKPPVSRLFAEKSRFHSVKQALHTAVPERLLSRDTERAAIRSFLEEKLLQQQPSGSLYISGAPGTGKTACLKCVLQEMKSELTHVQTVVVNCMSVRSSHSIFPLLAEALRLPGSHSGLQKFLTEPGPTVLLVLDEMDQLDSKAQDVLYTIFEWPYLPKSRLCLIGIANALDLTDRILPRLQARPQCRPQLLNFPPYTRQELVAIVQDRLAQASADSIMDASAVQFCARKVSAVSGDARKALDICRRAVEVVEGDERKRSPGPKVEAKGSRVSLPQVARVLSEVYGDRMASQSGGVKASHGESIPLQQKLLICCVLIMTRKGRCKEVFLGKVYEIYSQLCAREKLTAVGQSECISLCSLLESRGIFALKTARDARLTRVSLRMSERDVENALRDRVLVGNILTAGLPS